MLPFSLYNILFPRKNKIWGHSLAWRAYAKSLSMLMSILTVCFEAIQMYPVNINDKETQGYIKWILQKTGKDWNTRGGNLSLALQYTMAAFSSSFKTFQLSLDLWISDKQKIVLKTRHANHFASHGTNVHTSICYTMRRSSQK